MKTKVARTSLEAYHSMRDGLQDAERAVMRAFPDKTVQLTRKQIVAAIGMDLSGVCGRVKSLIEKNRLVVRGSCIDPTTNNRQQLVGLPVETFIAQTVETKPSNNTKRNASQRSTKSDSRRADTRLVQMELC